MDIMKLKKTELLAVYSQTLVGCLETDFPCKHGNCFSAQCQDGKIRRVLNFNAENFEELVRRGLLGLKALIINDTYALMADARVKNSWYMDRWCEVCCPKDLLPAPQRLKHFLDIERGIRKEHNGYTQITLRPENEE